MSFEIERKFLPSSDAWRKERSRIHHIRQGYIARSNGNTVRIRISDTPKQKRAVLCIKGPLTAQGVPEHEFNIGVEEAEALLLLCADRVIEKKRHHIRYYGLIFEVDEFLGNLAGNVLIEVELAYMGQPVTLPSWVGPEVTDDKRYTNVRLCSLGWPHPVPEQAAG